MTIFEYLLCNGEGSIYTDECGNAYAENITDIDFFEEFVRVDYNSYFIPKDLYEKYSEIDIIITEDESILEVSDVRRPYYRMRGVPVTEEQAFEIIRRTDNFFRFEIEPISFHADYIGGVNFDNWLIMKNHYPNGYGWIHVDGTVGGNAITQKYPDITEFILEWFRNLLAFPYLDLIIAVTYWDENPPEVKFDENERALFRTAAYDKYFYDAILLGIYVHDRKIEILGKKDTIVRYREYDALYGNPREKFDPEYYMENKITQVDPAYLRRCIEAYGLDPDRELGKVQKYIWEAYHETGNLPF